MLRQPDLGIDSGLPTNQELSRWLYRYVARCSELEELVFERWFVD